MKGLKEWISTRRSLLRLIKKQVQWKVGEPSKGLLEYGKAYKREFLGDWRKSSFDRLYSEIGQSDIVLGSDFHSFAQAQRTHVRILRDLPEGRKVILMLECVESKYQTQLDDFMHGKIEEKEFLESVDWEGHWGFSWEHYRPLFDIAKKRGFEVKAVNKFYSKRTKTNLMKRDNHVSQEIKAARDEHQSHLIYVIFGDLHLAKSHLPKAMKERGLSLSKTLIVFQSSERLYLRLMRKNQEDKVDVFRGSRRRYCIMTAPPWVKWQSYFMFLETDSFDQGIEGEDEDTPDYMDYVCSLIRFIQDELKIEGTCNDVSVYSSSDPSVWKSISKYMSKSDEKVIDYFFKHDMSFFLSSGGIFYLSRPSLNHASSLVGKYLQAKLSLRKRGPWLFPKDFLAYIWLEGLGFFVSKLINPKRKAEDIHLIRNQLEALSPEDKVRESLLLVLDQKMTEIIFSHTSRSRHRRYRPREKRAYIEAGRILGTIMGEQIYLFYRKKRMDRKVIKNLFKEDIFGENFETIFLKTMKKLESKGMNGPEILA